MPRGTSGLTSKQGLDPDLLPPSQVSLKGGQSLLSSLGCGSNIINALPTALSLGALKRFPNGHFLSPQTHGLSINTEIHRGTLYNHALLLAKLEGKMLPG